MDGLNGTTRIDSRLAVNERGGGSRKGDAEAFRRALQDNAGDGTEREREPDPPKPATKPPMRSGLQPKAADGRQQEQPRHIDVYA